MAKEIKEKIDIKYKKETIPLLLLYAEDGEIKSEINHTDIDNFDPVILYGHLKLYLKKIEKDLLKEED